MEPIICDRCKTKLEELGGLLFSPPVQLGELLIDLPKEYWGAMVTKKIHLCTDCYSSVVNDVRSYSEFS